ncbi:F-box and associated interaction domains-containing protein [Striga asiatica]|uniref:F-box and associated interaction domains-containing protein n=1 Tax=Striga asiatica TaxID=4170 RepID=A0A5A7PHN4_STRAF|nr:F-box and associated interaction domains-containing protein [Striga asiatica]
MSDYLPQEIWANVFLWLPVKMLIGIRSVCKYFDHIIRSPSFISDHLANSKQHQIPLVRYAEFGYNNSFKEHYALIPNHLTYLGDIREIDFPFRSECYKHFKVIGACNGLICLSDENYRRSRGIILWNPSIRRYLALPKPQLSLKSLKAFIFTYVVGFGYDCGSDDYKVLRITNVCGIRSRKNQGVDPPMPGPVVEMYTVKSGSWRNLNIDELTFPYLLHETNQAFVQGCLHWLNGQSSIACFNLKNEVFNGGLGLPEGLTGFGWDSQLAVLGEKLAFVVNPTPVKEIANVWAMEEYGEVGSWRKLYNVDTTPRYFLFVGFTDNGNMMCTLDRKRLYCYDPDMDFLNNLCTCGIKGSFHVEMYVESLVLVDGESAVSRSEAITLEGEDWFQKMTVRSNRHHVSESNHLKSGGPARSFKGNVINGQMGATKYGPTFSSGYPPSSQSGRSPFFISDHLANSKQNQILLVRYLRGREKSKRKEHYALIPNDLEYLENIREIDFPFKPECYKHFKVIGACNGLICLSDESYRRARGIILWNPSIKRYLALPKPQLSLKSLQAFNFTNVVGFGYDCGSDDYKVLRITHVYGIRSGKNRRVDPPKPGPVIEMYTVKSGSWRNLNIEELPFPYLLHTNQADACIGRNSWSSIACFDLRNEVFKGGIDLPESAREWDFFHLAVLGEKLAIVVDHTPVKGIANVWAMEEYGEVGSWRKLYNVDTMPGYFLFVGFTDNGNIMGTIDRNKLYCYDPDKCYLENLCTRGAVGSFHVEMYVEGLVLVDGESAVPRSEAITLEGEDW